MIEKIQEGAQAPLNFFFDALAWINTTIWVLGIVFTMILIKVNIYNEPVKLMYLSFDKEVKNEKPER